MTCCIALTDTLCFVRFVSAGHQHPVFFPSPSFSAVVLTSLLVTGVPPETSFAANVFIANVSDFQDVRSHMCMLSDANLLFMAVLKPTASASSAYPDRK